MNESFIVEFLSESMMIDSDDHEMREALGKVKNARVFLVAFPPTVENVAKWLLREINERLGLPATGVTVWETESLKSTCLVMELPELSGDEP